ncbi:protein ORF124 [Lake sturgeon herpesvirus]|nr:protein ORF124 [Lake sturgeon herpesvirus]
MSILRHPKLLSAIDLSTFQHRLPSKVVIDIYFLCPKNSPSSFLSCHTEVFDRYLKKFSVAKTPADPNAAAYVIEAPYEATALFLTCLYVHYLGLIDDDGHFVDNHYALSLKHTPYLFDSLQELARFYDLAWLDAAYNRVMVLNKAVVGPVYYHQNHNELVTVGRDRLASSGAPSNLKAFTASPDGSVWYVLCAWRGAHNATITEVWMKEAHNQHWLKLTEVTDPCHQRPANRYQLCLSEHVCLYVLFDGTRLECYNLAARTWTKITLPCYEVSHTLSQTGDGSLPACLVADSRAGQVTMVVLAKQNWAQSASSKEPHLSHYKCRVLTEYDWEGCYNNDDNDDDDDDEARWLKFSVGSAVEYYNQILKHHTSLPDPLPYLDPYIVTLERVVDAISSTGRRTATHDYFIDPDRAVALQTQQTQLEDRQSPSDHGGWLKVVVYNHSLCGLKGSTGQWWQKKIVYSPRSRAGEWVLMFPQPLGEWVWNPKSHKLSDVVTTGCHRVGVDQDVVDIDLFNPNTVNQTMAKSRFTKYESNPLKDPQNEIIPIPTNDLATPVMLFLLNMTEQMVELVKTQDVSYFNGGVKHLKPGDPETDLQLYTQEPPAEFVIKKQSFETVLRHNLKPDPPVFMGMGFNVQTSFNFGCLPFFVDHQINVFKYKKGQKHAVLK